MFGDLTDMYFWGLTARHYTKELEFDGVWWAIVLLQISLGPKKGNLQLDPWWGKGPPLDRKRSVPRTGALVAYDGHLPCHRDAAQRAGTPRPRDDSMPAVGVRLCKEFGFQKSRGLLNAIHPWVLGMAIVVVHIGVLFR